jgi:hypothetical protein
MPCKVLGCAYMPCKVLGCAYMPCKVLGCAYMLVTWSPKLGYLILGSNARLAGPLRGPMLVMQAMLVILKLQAARLM